MRPLPFITVPIYRAKGFKDSTSDRVEGGKLKFAIRVLPLMETDACAWSCWRRRKKSRSPRRNAGRKNASSRRRW